MEPMNNTNPEADSTEGRPPLEDYLDDLGDSIKFATEDYDELGIPDSPSRVLTGENGLKMTFIYHKSPDPEVVVQKEFTDDDGIDKAISLRWRKNFPGDIDSYLLLLLNPGAKKDKRREIRGYSLKAYTRDREQAYDLVEQATELLSKIDG